MVQVASLRIQIEAQQAKQAAQEVRRELDAVAVSATKADVSTDKLERQMEQLLAVTKGVAVSTHATAQGIERMSRGQQTAAVVVERTTEKLVRQEAAGFKLTKMFGGLAARTAATGGAFLAADFLARVAGANSLFDLMNKGLDKLAASFRNIFIEAKSFNDVLKEIGAQKPLDDSGLAEFLTQAGGKSRTGLSATFPGTTIPLNVPKLAGENEFLAGGIQKKLAEFEQDIASARKTAAAIGATGDYAATVQAYERLRAFETFRAGQVQADIDRMAKFFEDMPKSAEKAKNAIDNAAAILSSPVPLGGPRSAAGIAGGKVYTGLGFTGTDPFSLAIGAGGLAAQAGAKYATAGIGRDLSGFKQFGGQIAGEAQGAGFWGAQIAGAGAYAAALSAVAVEQEKINKSSQRAKQNAIEFGQAVAGSFEDALFNARSLEEGFEMVSKSLLRVIFNQLVTQNLAAGIAGIFSAKGNVFANGDVVPFAKGGILSGPVVFPLNGGKTGVAGEAGPEAVVPLGRNSKGELGIKGGGQTVVFNITTQDANSFRRSQKQISADMRRVLGA